MLNVAERRRLSRPHRLARSAQGAVRVGAVAHDGASTRSQQLASWLPFGGSADADTLIELPMLTSRSRDLARNNGIASGYVQTTADNIVGTGFRLNATPDWRALGKTPEWAEAWAENTEARWALFADSVECDAARRRTFAGLTTLIHKSATTSGDALALPIWQPEPGSAYATRLHILESDQLCNPQGAMDSATRRGGIKIDAYGRHLSYAVRSSHPGDVLFAGGAPATWEEIPATTAWGRRRVIFVADGDRPGLTRAKSAFTSVLQQFKQCDRYSTAELDAAVTNALIAMIIESPLDSEALLAMFDNGAGLKDWLDAKGVAPNRARLKSGSIIPLAPGEQMKAFNPARPATGFDAFMQALLHHLAVGLNIPYVLLAKDFSKTNYSSARAAMLEAWRFFKGRRQWLIDSWVMPVYELWLEEAVSKGEIEAPDFYAKKAAYLRSRWIGGGRGWVDPVKEAQAAKMRIDAKLSTLEAECAEQGYDWRDVLTQQAREKKFGEKLGLDMSAAPAAPPAPTRRSSETEDGGEGSDPVDQDTQEEAVPQ